MLKETQSKGKGKNQRKKKQTMAGYENPINKGKYTKH